MILVTWETAGSPIEVLGLRIKDEALRQICNPSKLERDKEELANVLVYCFSLANVCDIEVTDAVVNKLKKKNSKYPVEKFRGRACL